MPGEGTAGASDVTFDQVEVLNGKIGTLATALQTIVSTGSTLANDTGWEGNSRDRFDEIWEGGGWDTGATDVNGNAVSDVRSALEASVVALEEISGTAEQSATNITDADASGAGIA